MNMYFIKSDIRRLLSNRCADFLKNLIICILLACALTACSSKTPRMGTFPGPADPAAVPDSFIHKYPGMEPLLETIDSGKNATLEMPDGRRLTIRPVDDYISASGERCRIVGIDGEGTMLFCKSGSGKWNRVRIFESKVDFNQ